MSMSRYNQDKASFIPEFGNFFARQIFKIFGEKETGFIKYSDLKE